MLSLMSFSAVSNVAAFCAATTVGRRATYLTAENMATVLEKLSGIHIEGQVMRTVGGE